MDCGARCSVHLTALRRLRVLVKHPAAWPPAGHLEICPEHLVRHRYGEGRSFTTGFNDDGYRDLRVLERREACEPGVGITRPVVVLEPELRRSRLAGDQDLFLARGIGQPPLR